VVKIIRIKALVLATVFGLAVLFMTLHWLGQAPAVQAREQVLTEPVKASSSMQQAPFPEFDIIDLPVVTTDTLDLGGNVLGLGVYDGKLKCNGDNCNQKASLELLGTSYEYKFSTRQASDPTGGSLIVAGTGTLTSNGHKQRFTFFASFINNLDGTIFSRYDASIPEASFIIPRAPGTMKLGGG
jgi:hypothetical protein